MTIAWDEDDPGDLEIIAGNLQAILLRLIREAPLRSLPTVAQAQEWHRAIYRGARLPVAYFAGEVRDSDPRFPLLIDYEVLVGNTPGVPSRAVPEALQSYEMSMQRAVHNLDRAIPVGAAFRDIEQLRAVLTLCAYAHGEWVRIHPFANGNGRTARMWANWCALRYDLPPFVSLKPRPQGRSYARASAESMRGEHRAMVEVFSDMLGVFLQE